MIDFIQSNQEPATLIFSAVVVRAIYSCVCRSNCASCTWNSPNEESSTEPKLVAFVEPREEFVNFAHLYIQNIGTGPAFDVSFELSSNSDDETSHRSGATHLTFGHSW